MPVCVRFDAVASDLAMPKSMILTEPSSRMRMLAGLMSRWMIEWRWA